MQLPLDGIQAGHSRLEEPRLNDAHVDSKVVDIAPENIEFMQSYQLQELF